MLKYAFSTEWEVWPEDFDLGKNTDFLAKYISLLLHAYTNLKTRIFLCD